MVSGGLSISTFTHINCNLYYLSDWYLIGRPFPSGLLPGANPPATFAQVSSVVLNNMPVPLPPLPEQHRIVARIESLFAKLDEVKEKAQAVIDGYEDRI